MRRAVWKSLESLLFIFSLVLTCTSSPHPAFEDIPSFGIAASVVEAELSPPRREEFGGGRIIEISHYYREDMPAWESEDGLGQFLRLPRSMKDGDIAYFSEVVLPVHSGTHVDTPAHVFNHYFEAGFDVDTVDLEVLNGHALLVDVPRDKNITGICISDPQGKGFHKVEGRLMTLKKVVCQGQHQECDDDEVVLHQVQHQEYNDDVDCIRLMSWSLNIPRGIHRVLFRTLNTDRKLMWKKEFDTSYVGFMKDGAQWLVDNTDIKLVGIDYLSIAAYEECIPSHLVLLERRVRNACKGLPHDYWLQGDCLGDSF